VRSRRVAESACLAMAGLGREAQKLRPEVSALVPFVVVAAQECWHVFQVRVSEPVRWKRSAVFACALAWVEEAQFPVLEAFARALASEEEGAVGTVVDIADTAALHAVASALGVPAACAAFAAAAHRVPVASWVSAHWEHAASARDPSLLCWSCGQSSSPISCHCQESRPARAQC
jgi:hypothetical protein